MGYAVDTVLAPWSSVAAAVRRCAPIGGLVHTILPGLLLVSPSLMPSRKNSSRAIVPSPSKAVAFTVMVGGARKLAPLVGLIMLTDGGRLRESVGTPSRSITNQISVLV